MVCSTLSMSDSFTPAVAGTLVWTIEMEVVASIHNFATSHLGLWLEAYLFLTVIVYENRLLHFPVSVVGDHCWSLLRA